MNREQSQPEEQARSSPPPNRVASDAQVTQYITTIKNAPQQIGEHVVRALQHPNTVAVLTTVVVGPGGGQHVISAALNPGQLAQIEAILRQAELECDEEVPCVGFHCLIQPQGDSAARASSADAAGSSDADRDTAVGANGDEDSGA
ncbi:MAG: hypothetical protein D6753_06770 [Planctomycetota bacterium]|nr:MAG: hypothetical protein D6753_06770 [Planctomycetota bacterium]